MNTINLVVGDWSNDGHGQTEVITIESNLTLSEIVEAYEKGKTISGIDLEYVCAEYQQNTFGRQVYDKLVELGMLANSIESEVENDDIEVNISPFDFAYIYMFIVSLGNPDLKYEIIKPDAIRIGGYGLFY